uniref:Uncharacterized protein n=1 Tax=Romanomermis culicivorax TaxID=13658 RepID=A0A915L1P5_ROMCU
MQSAQDAQIVVPSTLTLPLVGSDPQDAVDQKQLLANPVPTIPVLFDVCALPSSAKALHMILISVLLILPFVRFLKGVRAPAQCKNVVALIFARLDQNYERAETGEIEIRVPFVNFVRRIRYVEEYSSTVLHFAVQLTIRWKKRPNVPVSMTLKQVVCR